MSVLTALAWGEFLESHAHRAYAAAIDSATSAAREIVRHARRGDLQASFSLRDVMRPCWSGLTERSRVLEALELLDEYGWIRTVDVPSGSAGGRPTLSYLLNPKALPR